jgi:hypothetical protein
MLGGTRIDGGQSCSSTTSHGSENIMKLTRLVKDANSGKTGCPAVYATDDLATVVVQGKVLDAATASDLIQVADDELAVALPRETILRAAAMLADGGR